MSDLKVLTVVRDHLLTTGVAARVHLTLPPKAIYPLVLIELEEMWTAFPRHASLRIKFKVSVYSHTPGPEEATQISQKLRDVMEHDVLKLPMGQTATCRFLSCVREMGPQTHHVIHHFYDALIRG